MGAKSDFTCLGGFPGADIQEAFKNRSRILPTPGFPYCYKRIPPALHPHGA
jgi:hypothetical protein